MRVSVAVNAAMVAAAPPAQESRFVVLGTDGRVVPNADPTLFLTKTRLPTVFLDHVHELQVFSPALKDSSPDEFTHIQVDGEAIAVAVQTVDESSLVRDCTTFSCFELFSLEFAANRARTTTSSLAPLTFTYVPPCRFTQLSLMLTLCCWMRCTAGCPPTRAASNVSARRQCPRCSGLHHLRGAGTFHSRMLAVASPTDSSA